MTFRILAVVVLFLLARPAAAQTGNPIRTPDLPGPWVGLPGVLHLDLRHRFDESDDAAVDDVSLTTLGAAWGIGGYALAGLTFVTGSEPGEPDVDEWEASLRFSPFTSAAGATLDLGLTAAYNADYGSFDGELTAGLPLEGGRVHALGTLRLLGDAFGTEDSRWFVGGGVIFRPPGPVSLSADVITPADPLSGESFAWGADARLHVPSTPVTIALEATNTRTTTLQASATRGGGTRWGVRVYVPVPLARWLGGGGGSDVDDSRAGQADLTAVDTVAVSVADDGYAPARVVVRPGTYVRWTNNGAGIHSISAADGSWDSPLLAPGDPGEAFGRVFTEVGEYAYRCRLHPEHGGVVVVEAGGL